MYLLAHELIMNNLQCHQGLQEPFAIYNANANL